MLRIGLTGGIGSGKSTVSLIFTELGIPVIDADQISRELVEPGQPALARLVALLGDSILTADGRLERSRMRERVFADIELRRQVESLLHPLIKQQLIERSKDHVVPYVVLAIPLLIEKAWESLVDRVLVIDCPPEEQLRRTMQRDDSPSPQIEAIMASQVSRSERLEHADDIIDNNGDLAHLRRQVSLLHQRYLAIARNDSAQ